jgi:hypothetical protein
VDETDTADAAPGEQAPAVQPAGPVRRHLAQIHLEWVAVLVVVFVVLVVVGWSLRPQSSGFRPIQTGQYVVVTGQGVGTITQTLTRTRSGEVQLQVRSDQTSSGPWTVSAYFTTGYRVCQPANVVNAASGFSANAPIEPYRVRHPQVVLVGGPPTPDVVVASRGRVILARFCWASTTTGAPVKLNGSYLNALFPGAGTADPDADPPPPASAVTSVLVANAGDTSDFAVQTGTADSDSNPAAWSWTRSSNDPPARITAVNTSNAQNDQFHAFLAGIVLGIAGGALITILQELFAPFNRRRDERYEHSHPLPTG